MRAMPAGFMQTPSPGEIMEGHRDAPGVCGSAASLDPVLVDFSGALTRLGDDNSLFIKLAQYFVGTSPQIVNSLRQSLRNGDMTEAIDLTHNLKGLAGSAGLISVAENARDLEALLKQAATPGPIAAAEEKLTASLAAGNAELANYMRAQTRIAPPEPVIPPSAERAAAAALLAELEAQLAASNMRAVGIFGEFSDQFGIYFPGRMTPLATAINDLDFSTAQKLCAELRTCP